MPERACPHPESTIHARRRQDQPTDNVAKSVVTLDFFLPSRVSSCARTPAHQAVEVSPGLLALFLLPPKLTGKSFSVGPGDFPQKHTGCDCSVCCPCVCMCVLFYYVVCVRGHGRVCGCVGVGEFEQASSQQAIFSSSCNLAGERVYTHSVQPPVYGMDDRSEAGGGELYLSTPLLLFLDTPHLSSWPASQSSISHRWNGEGACLHTPAKAPPYFPPPAPRLNSLH